MYINVDNCAMLPNAVAKFSFFVVRISSCEERPLEYLRIPIVCALGDTQLFGGQKIKQPGEDEQCTCICTVDKHSFIPR